MTTESNILGIPSGGWTLLGRQIAGAVHARIDITEDEVDAGNHELERAGLTQDIIEDCHQMVELPVPESLMDLMDHVKHDMYISALQS